MHLLYRLKTRQLQNNSANEKPLAFVIVDTLHKKHYSYNLLVFFFEHTYMVIPAMIAVAGET
jgi:hypothetical protein